MKMLKTIKLIFVVLTLQFCLLVNFANAFDEPLYKQKADWRILKAFDGSEQQVLIIQITEKSHPTKSLPAKLAGFAKTKTAILSSLDASNLDSSNFDSSNLKDSKIKYQLKYDYNNFPLMAVLANRQTFDALLKNPDVDSIHFNSRDKLHLESSLPFIGTATYHENNHKGQGTAVAVLDTPVRYWNGYFGTCGEAGQDGCMVSVWENFSDQDAMDVALEAHGTNVAGIVLGVAPETKILSLNVFTCTAQDGCGAFESDLLEALNWVAENAATYNIVSANMSLGSERDDPAPCNRDPRFVAIKSLLVDHNVLAVFSSGNEAKENSIDSPGCVTPAITVGAYFDLDTFWFMGSYCSHLYASGGEVACFTNRNGSLDIMAPGVWITAGGIENYSGTSMSAPHVSGAIALMQSYWLETDGSFKTASQAHKHLMIIATINKNALPMY